MIQKIMRRMNLAVHVLKTLLNALDNKKGDLHEISMNIIKNYWEVEAKDSCLDHFHVISMEGLLKVSDIKSIGRSVW